MNRTAGVSRVGNPIYPDVNRRPSLSVTPLAALSATTTPQTFSGEAPHFGGSFGKRLVNDVLLPTFENINENYISGFVATDVGGIWLARIATSLVTGRIPYNPQQDPEAQNLSLPHQVARYTIKNLQGLNWINFWEETKREIASGPGVLMASGLTFLAARHWLKGSIVLPFPVMQGLCAGFQQHLDARGGDIGQESHYREALANYITSLFADPKIRTTHLDTVLNTQDIQKALSIIFDSRKTITETDLRHLQESRALRPLLESSPGMGNQLRSLLGPEASAAKAKAAIAQQLEHRPLLNMVRKPDAGRLTYGDYLNRWSHAWVDTLFHEPSGKNGVKARHEALQTLEQDLREALETFNRNHHLRTAPESLHQTRTVLIRYAQDDKKAQTPDRKELSQLTWELRQWGDFAHKVWQKGKQTAASTDWPRLVEKMQKQLVVQKYFFGTLATVLSCFHMAHLAFWAQNHSSYQATRLIRHKTPTDAEQNSRQSPPSSGAAASLGNRPADYPTAMGANGFGPGTAAVFSNKMAWPSPFSIQVFPYDNEQRRAF